MRSIKYICLLALAGTLLLFSPPRSHAQISVQIGPAPVCPYGYYPYAPYNCAPYGYYGPEWFSNGVFIGAGPWFHGPHNFHGHINNRYDVRHGYHGSLPHRGAHAAHRGHSNFRGNAEIDGHGNAYRGGNRGGHGHR